MTETCLPIVQWLKNWFTSTDDLLDKTYPVGSIYMSVNSTSPATLFGGTWQKIEGRFLLASGTTSGEDPNPQNTYTLGDTDGEATHSLTQSEMPRHTHTQNEHRHILPNGAIVYSSNYSGAIPNGNSKKYGTNTDAQLATHNTTATNQYTGGTGSSQSASNGSAHNNMPPYLVVNVWERTA